MRLGRLLMSSKGKMEGCEHREAIDVPPSPPHSNRDEMNSRGVTGESCMSEVWMWWCIPSRHVSYLNDL